MESSPYVASVSVGAAEGKAGIALRLHAWLPVRFSDCALARMSLSCLWPAANRLGEPPAGILEGR